MDKQRHLQCGGLGMKTSDVQQSAVAAASQGCIGDAAPVGGRHVGRL